jgi:hypothetical protein
MPFVTDGSVHHSGVRNEHTVADLLSAATPTRIQAAYPDSALTFLHRGGTRGVDDVEIHVGGTRVSGISIKHHGSSGTFDYINTSKVLESLPDAEGLCERVAELRTLHFGDASAIPAVRKTIRDGVRGLWATMTSDRIRTLLQRVNERNSDWVCIKTPTGLVTARHEALTELSLYPSDHKTTYELRGTADSRQIWRTTDGRAVNTHLRVRLALNNGVTALLGLSSANKNSNLTVKIQQDNVRGLLDALAES